MPCEGIHLVCCLCGHEFEEEEPLTYVENEGTPLDSFGFMAYEEKYEDSLICQGCTEGLDNIIKVKNDIWAKYSGGVLFYCLEGADEDDYEEYINLFLEVAKATDWTPVGCSYRGFNELRKGTYKHGWLRILQFWVGLGVMPEWAKEVRALYREGKVVIVLLQNANLTVQYGAILGRSKEAYVIAERLRKLYDAEQTFCMDTGFECWDWLKRVEPINHAERMR